MVRKKRAKKIKADNDKKDIVSSKKSEKGENRMLFWLLIVVGIVFASVLVPYFWVESSKSFDYAGINWLVENYQDLEIFHGRFLSFTDSNLHYNVFLRSDPRTNDVKVIGKIDSFRYGGIVSLSPEVDNCRGELSRVMLDLGAFLKQGVGVGHIESASNDELIANESGRKFVDCENAPDRTVIIVEIGEPRIVQDETNPYCYTIYSESCDDSSVVEKFITKSVEDFRDSHPRKE